MDLPNVVIFGLPLVVLVPGMVNLLRSWGLDSRYAGAAAIGCTAAVLGLVELQDSQAGGAATWLLASLVYGLASAGLFSQVKKLTEGQ